MIAALALCTACAGSDGTSARPDPSTTSTIAEPTTVIAVEVAADPGFEIGARTGAYEVVYLVEDLSGGTQVQSTERVVVRPPFESRLETRTGAPPGGEVTSLQIATMDRLQFGSPGAPLVVHRVPGIATSDIRLAPVLGPATEAGLLRLAGQREIAGLRCQVVVSATLLGAGALQPIGDDERAESCVDADGLLLEETLYIDGDASFRRVATEVRADRAVPDDLFDAGPVTAPVDQGGGSVLPVDPAAGALGPFWELPDAALPDGWRELGRFAVVPPQPENFGDPDRAANVVAGTADVFVLGVDTVVVYQGATSGGVEAFVVDGTFPDVDGGALGTGTLRMGATGTELRFPQPEGRFVHVIGTLDPDTLTSLARTLVSTEGTGLVYLDR